MGHEGLGCKWRVQAVMNEPGHRVYEQYVLDSSRLTDQYL